MCQFRSEGRAELVDTHAHADLPPSIERSRTYLASNLLDRRDTSTVESMTSRLSPRHRSSRGLVAQVLSALTVAALGSLFVVGSVSGQAVPVSLTLNPTSVQAPGASTARVTVQGVAAANTITLQAAGADVQIANPSLFNGGWLPAGCTGAGTNTVTCPYANGSYPLVLDFGITVPAGATAPASWNVIATETATGASALQVLTIQAPPSTTAAPTTAAPTTAAPTTAAPTTVVGGVPATTAPGSATTTPGSGAALPATGGETVWIALVAIAAIALGGAAVGVARRRPSID